MATELKTAKVIGLWLDTTEAGGPTHNGTWIVSRDVMNERGQAEQTRTVATFGAGEYAAAKDEAIRLATKDGLCVIETSESGGTSTVVYAPEGVTPIIG